MEILHFFGGVEWIVGCFFFLNVCMFCVFFLGGRGRKNCNKCILQNQKNEERLSSFHKIPIQKGIFRHLG